MNKELIQHLIEEYTLTENNTQLKILNILNSKQKDIHILWIYKNIETCIKECGLPFFYEVVGKLEEVEVEDFNVVCFIVDEVGMLVRRYFEKEEEDEEIAYVRRASGCVAEGCAECVVEGGDNVNESSGAMCSTPTHSSDTTHSTTHIRSNIHIHSTTHSNTLTYNEDFFRALIRITTPFLKKRSKQVIETLIYLSSKTNIDILQILSPFYTHKQDYLLEIYLMILQTQLHPSPHLLSLSKAIILTLEKTKDTETTLFLTEKISTYLSISYDSDLFLLFYNLTKHPDISVRRCCAANLYKAYNNDPAVLQIFCSFFEDSSVRLSLLKSACLFISRMECVDACFVGKYVEWNRGILEAVCPGSLDEYVLSADVYVAVVKKMGRVDGKVRDIFFRLFYCRSGRVVEKIRISLVRELGCVFDVFCMGEGVGEGVDGSVAVGGSGMNSMDGAMDKIGMDKIGVDTIGVDINTDTVENNRAEGINTQDAVENNKVKGINTQDAVGVLNKGVKINFQDAVEGEGMGVNINFTETIETNTTHPPKSTNQAEAIAHSIAALTLTSPSHSPSHSLVEQLKEVVLTLSSEKDTIRRLFVRHLRVLRYFDKATRKRVLRNLFSGMSEWRYKRDLLRCVDGYVDEEVLGWVRELGRDRVYSVRQVAEEVYKNISLERC